MLRIVSINVGVTFLIVFGLIMASQSCRSGFEHADLVSLLAEGNLKFALKLYKELGNDNEGGNVFVSPFSVTMALSMVSVGAEGQTANELEKTLGLDHLNSREDINLAALDILKSLCLDGSNGSRNLTYTLNAANGLFIEETFNISEEYKNNLTTYFLSRVEPVDFKNNSEAARNEINSWVAEKTKDKITNLFPPGILSSDTRLVVTNAVYFKGNWAQKFNPRLTKKQEFHVNGKKSVHVDTMFIRDKFPYAENDELKCQIIELSYLGDRLSMYVILPKERDGLPELETRLTPTTFKSLRNFRPRPKSVVLSIPKFKLDLISNVEAALKTLGVNQAFISGQADLSSISEEELYISKIIHKAFVEVNEEGSEAAAATAVGINTFSLEIDAEFKADHPFLFIIYDKVTDLILFIGRLNSPL
ncbi:hypothetical protein CHUAL_008857 [Chamberlinius hualienensis]